MRDGAARKFASPAPKNAIGDEAEKTLKDFLGSVITPQRGEEERRGAITYLSEYPINLSETVRRQFDGNPYLLLGLDRPTTYRLAVEKAAVNTTTQIPNADIIAKFDDSADHYVKFHLIKQTSNWQVNVVINYSCNDASLDAIARSAKAIETDNPLSY